MSDVPLKAAEVKIARLEAENALSKDAFGSWKVSWSGQIAAGTAGAPAGVSGSEASR